MQAKEWSMSKRDMDKLTFMAGSCAYPAIELLWRGKTHSSMAIAGGVCLCLINRICCERLKEKKLPIKCLAGSGIITGVELLTGLVVNHLFNFDVWDYSQLPMNILGQICLPYCILWFLLTIPAIGLCDLLGKFKLFS